MPLLKVSLVLTGISIGLLVLYGADVGVAQGEDQGFLPFDHKTTLMTGQRLIILNG